MTSVRFHRSLYFEQAITDAVAAFASHAKIEIDSSDPDYVIVQISSSGDADRDALVGAFANYVLGASVHAHQQLSG